jgi:hypothetical protein
MRAEKIKEYERIKMAEKMAAEEARLEAVKEKHQRLKAETQRVREHAGLGKAAKDKLTDTFGRIDLTKVAEDPAAVTFPVLVNSPLFDLHISNTIPKYNRWSVP